MEDRRQSPSIRPAAADLAGLGERRAGGADHGPGRSDLSPAGLNTRSAYLTSLTAALAEAVAARFGDRFGPQARLRPCPGRLCSWEAFFDSLGPAGGSFALSPARQADAPPAVVGLTPEAAGPLISALLGSRRPESHNSNRPPSAIQRRLLRTLVVDLAEALGDALAHAPAGRHEWDVPPQAPPGDRDALAGGQAAVMRLSVELNRRSGAILLAVDSSVLPAERPSPPEQTPPEAPDAPGGAESPDAPTVAASDHAPRLAEDVAEPADAAAPSAGEAHRAGVMDLTVRVDGGEIDIRELAALSAGDVVLSDAGVQDPVVVYANGRPAFLARLGRAGDRRAIRLLRRLDADDSPPPAGERQI